MIKVDETFFNAKYYNKSYLLIIICDVYNVYVITH